ncbi:MAG TPA: ribose 5-phosphate isomerase A [Acidobacteriota bacterium]|jgi:ribose 5-phosphate isomerase A
MKWTESSTFNWTSTITNLESKRKVARLIAQRVNTGDVIGIGSGSTAYVALEEVAARMRSEKLDFVGIPTSYETELACRRFGIRCASLLEHRPDWAFDGADEIDGDGNLIKGRGGALFSEKLVDGAAARLFIIADRSKLVSRLGTTFPIPVEVHPPAARWVEHQIRELGATEIQVRSASGKDGPVFTEHGNIMLDVRFQQIGASLEKDLKSICGVIESGLFWGYRPEVIVAD